MHQPCYTTYTYMHIYTPHIPNALRTWPSSLLRAHTTATSAHVPLPIQRLRPLSCQPPATRVALHVRPLASLPLEGSVSAQQPDRVLAAMPGSSAAFCSSLPCRINMQSELQGAVSQSVSQSQCVSGVSGAGCCWCCKQCKQQHDAVLPIMHTCRRQVSCTHAAP